ncbi:hypothetical protein BMR02_09065 [Methylococcaceae bacterium HT1]|nr:hypothetical protein BMR02_10225 [Methylococcaceae bacterium HT1]TXK98288.1 hypothetical protein BMR02_09065 [Methylococcaceae bacterium HT1]
MIVFLAPLSTAILNSPLPLAKEDKTNSQHIVSIYAELANGFAACLTKVSDLASAQTIFYGLQSLITAYIYIAEVYQEVYPNFWKQSYLFYGLASKLEIQDLNIEQHAYHSNTISKAFKHLLALYHCGLDQFRPRDMQTISTCLEKHTAQMLLGTKFFADKTSQYSGFDLKIDKPPGDLTHLNQSKKSALRFFSAYSVAQKINKNAPHEASGTGVIKAINRENLLQVAKTLSLSQKRKFTRFNKQSEHSGIFGFSKLIEHLRESSSLKPNPTNKKTINPIDARVAGGWEVPNIELVSEGYESIDAMRRNYEQNGLLREEKSRLNQTEKNSASKNIWAKAETTPQNGSPIRLEKFNTVDFSIKGYKIIFDTALNSSKVQIGDIIGIKNNNNMEIGVIRRIVQLTEHKLQLGIKLLALEPEVAYISLPNHDSIYAWAIFLPGIKKIMSSDSLIYNDSKFQCGEFVNLHRTGTEPASCRLNKLLHLSCAAMHVELFNSKIME